MIIQEATYSDVLVSQRREIAPAIYGCDCCKQPLENYPNEAQRLELKVWPERNGNDCQYYHFCSWACVLQFIPTIKSNYFADLPFLYFDEGDGKRSAKELVSILAKINQKQ